MAVALPDGGLVSSAGGTVTLDGSGSDGGPWGANVTYSWALTYPASGVTVTFDDAASATPMVTIPALPEGTPITFTFTLTVTGRGSGGGVAPGTDTAGDPPPATVRPKAWIARFGRTVAEQALEAIEGRMRATPEPGVEVAFAGARIGGGSELGSEADRAALREEEAQRGALRLADWLKGETDPEEAQRQSRAVTPRDLLTGSAFALTAETADKDLVSLWGRGAVTRFDGREGELTLDGEVVNGMLGADWSGAR